MALHDIQIGIGMENGRLPARVAMMHVDQRIYSIRGTGPG
jgi:hypothetical protein